MSARTSTRPKIKFIQEGFLGLLRKRIVQRDM